MESLDTVKAIILGKSDFCKDFDKCVAFYKDFLKQSNSTRSEIRLVLEVSSVRCGGSGGEDIKDCYYTKDDYIKLSCDQKGKLKKISEKRSSISGGGGSPEPT